MASPMHCNLLYFLIFFCINTTSFASDHISLNNSLSGSMTIISQGNNFELGFIQIGNKSLSPRYYLGIWYRQVPEITPIWIANRNMPISDPNTTLLKISTDGNLVLLDQNKTQIWSTNLTTLVSNSTICTLLDTGNLVLKYRSNSTANDILWQSMDYPTDSWLPGGKIGQSKVLGQQKLISWKNYDDPAEGLFSLELAIDGNGTSQFVISWNQSKPFWSSGKWNGIFFENVPELNAFTDDGGQNLFKYVSNENETYFTYSTPTGFLFTRLLMDTTGQIKAKTWLENSMWSFRSQPQTQCSVYAICGPFGICDPKSIPSCSCVRGFDEKSSTEAQLGDFTGGCTRNSPLQCSDTNGSVQNGQSTDRFFEMPSIDLPDNSHSLYASSIEDCKRACLQNCSCNAYAYRESCFVWYGDLLNLRQESDGSSGETLFVRLSASEFQKTNQQIKWIFVASGTSVIVSLACGIFIFLMVRRYQKRRLVISTNASESRLVAFRYGDVRRITSNFSERLGRGSFGSVFKGTLPNSCAIAVKKLERIAEVGEKQFRNEVRTIGIIQHVNLVRLRGFCSERKKRLLIYDYMPNGSLDKQLFRGSSHLNWRTRYQIALGAARGLAYLHESCVDCIIHCDVKPENILLDELFVPKIADFGMAKLVERDFSRVITTLRGTIGYLAPEWISGMAITKKVDVYSYGLVLMELLSGRRNSEKLDGKKVGYFPLLAAIELQEGNVLCSLLDPSLNGDANLGEVERVCRVACWCIQDEEHNRPTMVQVVQILEGLLEVSTPPIPRSLAAFGEHSGSLGSSKEQSLTQSNPMESVALMETRVPT